MSCWDNPRRKFDIILVWVQLVPSFRFTYEDIAAVFESFDFFLDLSKLDLVGLGWPFEQQFMGAETCKCPFCSWHRKAVSSWKKILRMGQWIFAEYAWTVFVRADLEAQVVLSHLVYRKSFLVLLVPNFLAERPNLVDEVWVEFFWMLTIFWDFVGF